MTRLERRLQRRESRMLRRGYRRTFGLLPALPPEMNLQMVQAYRIYAVGQYSQSATLLERVANSARASGLPRAPRLFFQAARANWHANQVSHGMDLMRTALDMLVAASAINIAGQTASLAMTELNSMSHKQEADQLRNYVVKIPGWQETVSETRRKKRPNRCRSRTASNAVLPSAPTSWIGSMR